MDERKSMLTVPIVLRCGEKLRKRVQYVFDSLMLAARIQVAYVSRPPSEGPWLLYAPSAEASVVDRRCVRIPHCPAAWEFPETGVLGGHLVISQGLRTFRKATHHDPMSESDVPFDLAAAAFYFLASCSERRPLGGSENRGLFENSVFRRYGIPQTIVDQYQGLLLSKLDLVLARSCWADRCPTIWPGGASHAVVLSHDVDFLSRGPVETISQGARTMLRHLVRQHAPKDAATALVRLLRAMCLGRDPYDDFAGIIAREKKMGVRASFLIAVGHRHKADVNYRLEQERVRRKLAPIAEAGFEVGLHGSVRSTERQEWYVEEVSTLAEYFSRPIGSRQHFLSFDYDSLFLAQEQSGIMFDMSMGYPDHPGPRCGFSHPYFPYSLEQDRPYRVLEIGLTLMDVTLRGYLRLQDEAAWRAIEDQLEHLRVTGGCASVVWHPIVFGGARDPGMDDLFWRLIQRVKDRGGEATDGRSINDYISAMLKSYPSFSAQP
jgi:hypothetical protein